MFESEPPSANREGAAVAVPVALPELPGEPLVSVLMASYNYGQYLEQALESVRRQTYRSIEVIVCDDGSTDDSCEMVERVGRRDARIRLIRKANGGVASALNAAYGASRGDVLCLLDADDLFMPEKVEAVVDHLRRLPEVGFVTHAMQVIDGTGDPLHEIPFVRRVETGWIAPAVRKRGGRWRNQPASALSFRREVARHLFPLPERELRREADGYLFTLAPLLTHVSFIDRVLSAYRLHGSNLTGTDRIDLSSTLRQLDARERVVGAAGVRLRALGLPELDIERHLGYLEAGLTRSLLEGRPLPELVRQARVMGAALLADDLYGLPRKLLGVLAYGGASLLPRARRAAWLTTILGLKPPSRRSPASR